MSWRRAPLYVQAHDLCHWLLERLASRATRDVAGLGVRLAHDAHAIVSEVALALTFPVDRAAHQAAADDAIVRLRVTLRLAEAIGLLTPRHVRHVAAELSSIGRMLGGWRRSTRQRTRGTHRTTGVEAPAAPPASSAAATSGTTPTGAAPPTGTGTTPATAGTTSASGSCFRPPNPRPRTAR